MSEPGKSSREEWDMKDEQLLNRMYRGETPENIAKITHQLCCDYVCGTWAKIKPEEMVLKRISGGLGNQLYYCGIPDCVETLDGEPRELAVRIYCKKWYNYYECEEKDERMTDMIIGVLMSEKKIGPKIYGIGPVGEVQEYIDCRPFFEPEEQDPLMVKELAGKLAQIHYLNPPIKRRNRYFETLQKWNQNYQKTYTNEYFSERGCHLIQKMHLTEEIEFIKRCVESLQVPTVFNHNDFRNSNILVKNKPDGDGNLRIGDYEFGTYGYRGWDFGWLFNAWGQSKKTSEPTFPSDEEIRRFLEFYVEECVKIHGPGYLKDPKNNVDNLIRETKVFRLGFTIFDMLMILQIEDKEFEGIKQVFDRSDLVKNFDSGIRAYFVLKDRFINEKAIPEEAIRLRDQNNKITH